MSNEHAKKQLRELAASLRQMGDGCEKCGASWPGSVYGAILENGEVEGRCFGCGCPRPIPESGYVKCYPDGLVESL